MKISTFLSRAAAYLSGGYNMPTTAQVEAAPLHVPEPDLPPPFSDRQIEAAPSHVPVKPLSYGWMAGTFNTPRLSAREEDALDRAIIRRFAPWRNL